MEIPKPYGFFETGSMRRAGRRTCVVIDLCLLLSLCLWWRIVRTNVLHQQQFRLFHIQHLICLFQLLPMPVFPFPVRFRTGSRKTPAVFRLRGLLEVTPGFEPGNESFADSCLTTWLCHHGYIYIICGFPEKSTFIFDAECPHERVGILWSGQRGSNSLPPPWQGGALPDELCPQMVPRAGVEPATRRFSVYCSTN